MGALGSVQFRGIRARGSLRDVLFAQGRGLCAISAASKAAWRKAYPPVDARRYAKLTGGFVTGLRGKDVELTLMEVIDELRQR